MKGTENSYEDQYQEVHLAVEVPTPKEHQLLEAVPQPLFSLPKVLDYLTSSLILNYTVSD